MDGVGELGGVCEGCSCISGDGRGHDLWNESAVCMCAHIRLAKECSNQSIGTATGRPNPIQMQNP